MSQDIFLNLIDADPEQPRKHFNTDKLAELAASMQANGLIVPILLRPVDDRLVIVHGERRYRAAQSLGWDSIRAEVRDVSPDEARWLSLVENVQRADLSPIEEAQAYKARLAQGLTQEQLGQRIGKSRSYIAQKVRLLKLPDDVQTSIRAGDIKEGHARQLLRVKDAKTQSGLCKRALTESWTVAQTQQAVDTAKLLAFSSHDALGQSRQTADTYLDSLKTMEMPSQWDNPVEVAIWAEQRLAHLPTLPINSILERQNDYAVVKICLERAAGAVLNKFEHGEADDMMLMGLDLISSMLNSNHEPRIISTIAKKMYKACPGMKLSRVSLELPEDTSFEQCQQVARILGQWASIIGECVT